MPVFSSTQYGSWPHAAQIKQDITYAPFVIKMRGRVMSEFIIVNAEFYDIPGNELPFGG